MGLFGKGKVDDVEVVRSSNTGVKGIVVLVFLGAIVTFIVTNCIRIIPAGYVGVVYNINGGVEDGVKLQGWSLLWPTQKLTLYRTATQQVYLSADVREGSEVPEDFDITCKDGIVNVDLEMSYNIPVERVPDIFSKYAGMDGEDVVNTFIRGKLKTYVSEITSQYSVLDVVMDKKAEVNTEITEYLGIKLEEFGLEVESANLSRVTPDEAVQQAISQRSQLAQEVEVERKRQEKLQLEADNKVIEANGEAAKKLIEAQNEAEMIRVAADAEAYANQQIAKSITQPLIDMEEAKARVAHGWVEVQGAGATIVDTTGK